MIATGAAAQDVTADTVVATVGETEITLGENVERLVNQVSALPEFQAGFQRENIEFQKVA